MPTADRSTDAAWLPALGWESLRWEPTAPAVHSRAEVRRQTGEYRAVIPPLIGAVQPRVSGELLADVEDATRALVEADSLARARLDLVVPGASAPMSAILLRTESASSSQIEQLTTSARQIALAELDVESGLNARTVLGNVRAMEAALELTGRITADAVRAVHRELMRDDLSLSEEAGRFRTQQVWIGPGDAGPRRADFVPPHHSRVDRAMHDLIDFIDRDDIPVLIQVAIAHAQFETIHPFVDGNGRTGRALAQAMLRSKELTTAAAVPISAGLLTATDRYFSALTAYRQGRPEPIIEEFAMAARTAAAVGQQLVRDLLQELDRSMTLLSGVRSDSAAHRILPHLIAHPVVNTRFLRAELGLGEMTALRAVATLVERGVLRERTGRRRERVWEHTGILDVLDAFAAGIRRASI